MSDQKRWFKLWHSALSDPDLIALPPEIRWAWAALGAYTNEHGTNGRIKIIPPNPYLSAVCGVTDDALLATIKLLPHIDIEEGKNGDGSWNVTWRNWYKYQVDSSASRTSQWRRSKRRGEEKRREEKREVRKDSMSGSGNPTPPASNLGDESREVLAWLNAKAGRNYRPSKTNLDFIRCRLEERITVHQLKAIVSRKCREWAGDPKMRGYLRPATLFNKTKCEQYLGELPALEQGCE